MFVACLFLFLLRIILCTTLSELHYIVEQNRINLSIAKDSLELYQKRILCCEWAEGSRIIQDSELTSFCEQFFVDVEEFRNKNLKQAVLKDYNNYSKYIQDLEQRIKNAEEEIHKRKNCDL